MHYFGLNDAEKDDDYPKQDLHPACEIDIFIEKIILFIQGSQGENGRGKAPKKYHHEMIARETAMPCIFRFG